MTDIPAGVVKGIVQVIAEELAARGAVPVLDVPAYAAALEARIRAIADTSIADARSKEPVLPAQGKRP